MHTQTDKGATESSLSELKMQLSDMGGLYLSVRVQTKSVQPEGIYHIIDRVLKIRVSAAPEKGKANNRVIEILANTFGVSKSQVELLSGQANTKKRFLITT